MIIQQFDRLYGETVFGLLATLPEHAAELL
jgi:hypothetical protein